MIRWFRYRRRGLSRRHPRWAALDARLDPDRDTTRVQPHSAMVTNDPSPWWTHPAPGAERLARVSDHTEVHGGAGRSGRR